MVYLCFHAQPAKATVDFKNELESSQNRPRVNKSIEAPGEFLACDYKLRASSESRSADLPFVLDRETVTRRSFPPVKVQTTSIRFAYV